MSFLNAEWRNLAIVNYEVEALILKKYLPFGTELDLWNDKCYISVVAFMFINTKILGIKIPFHINFEEVNLRFYVKRWENNKWKRGVVFIKEIVPKPAISIVANTIYNENYETLKMSHLWKETHGNLIVEYQWKKDNNWDFIKIIAHKEATEIKLHSFPEFITEHYWGYAKINSCQSNEYEVRHPRWEQYQIIDAKININFENMYGTEFSNLAQKKPASILLAKGSKITVENKNKIGGKQQ